MRSTQLSSIVSALNAYTSSRASESSPKDTIYIQANGGNASFVTSDGISSIVVKDIELSGSGKIYIKSRPFIQASKVVKGDISLVVDNSGLTLVSDKGGRASIPASESVTIVGPTGGRWANLLEIPEGDEFTRVMSLFCGEYEPVDRILFKNGIACTTNEIRLAELRLGWDIPTPFYLVKSVISGLKKLKGSYVVDYQKNRVRFSSNNIQVYTTPRPLITGERVGDSIINQDTTEPAIEVQSSKLMEAIKGVSDYDEYKRFSLVVSDDIKISSYNDGLNNISIDGIIYAQGKMSFLSSNFLDTLKALGTKTIRLHWLSESKAFITSKESPQWRITIAPVR